MIKKSLQHKGQLIPYEIQHAPRVTRRIHLRTDPEGALVVIAPKRMSKRAIHKTLQDRSDKVACFLADALARQRELPPCRYVPGEKHPYLGDYFPLDIVEVAGRRNSVERLNGCIRISTTDTSPKTVRKKLIVWYRQQAQRHFSLRLEAISKNAYWIGERLPPIRLRTMKRTWGSCSASGVITLNPRLIKAPSACIDYVIAHELCHLQQMNHSTAFYALQDALFPQWMVPKAHLKDKSHIYLHD